MNSQAQSVDAGAGKQGKKIRGDSLGICLYGALGIPFKGKFSNKSEQLLKKSQGKRGRCSSPDIDSGNALYPEIIDVPGNLFHGFIQNLGHKGVVCDREEVAVAALGVAERDVDIERGL